MKKFDTRDLETIEEITRHRIKHAKTPRERSEEWQKLKRWKPIAELQRGY